MWFITRFNTLRPKQNGRHFADEILKCIFLNENVWILKKISLKFVPKGQINNNPALVQVIAWRRSGDKPLSEPMMVRLPTHICVTRTQWVNLNQMLLKEIPGATSEVTLENKYNTDYLNLSHRLMHMCVSKLTITASDNGLVPARRQYSNIVNWTIRNKLQWNLNTKLYIFIQENVFENVV